MPDWLSVHPVSSLPLPKLCCNMQIASQSVMLSTKLFMTLPGSDFCSCFCAGSSSAGTASLYRGLHMHLYLSVANLNIHAAHARIGQQ